MIWIILFPVLFPLWLYQRKPKTKLLEMKEETKPEKAKPEKAKPEKAKPEKAKPEKAKPEKPKAKKLKAKKTKAKKLVSEVKVFVHGQEVMPSAVDYKLDTSTKTETIATGDKIALVIEKPKRQLRLMSKMSPAVKDWSIEANTFALVDNGDVEGLGKTVNIEVISWRPKASIFDAEGIGQTSYDAASPFFNEIVEAAQRTQKLCFAQYGPELTVRLFNSDEEVQLFCGTKSARHAIGMIGTPRAGDEWTLSARLVITKSNMSWAVIVFTKVQYQWMEQPIEKLKKKRLFNIVIAIKRGTWASGKKCYVRKHLAGALTRELERRGLTKKQIEKIQKKNAKFDAKVKAKKKRNETRGLVDAGQAPHLY